MLSKIVRRIYGSYIPIINIEGTINNAMYLSLITLGLNEFKIDLLIYQLAILKLLLFQLILLVDYLFKVKLLDEKLKHLLKITTLNC